MTEVNRIIGYDESCGKKFPRFSGPCVGCGRTDYGLSSSGPDFCGDCAMGTDPEVSKLKRELTEARTKIIDQSFAIGLLSGHFPPFNDKTREAAERVLAERKAEWEGRHAQPAATTPQPRR